MQLKLKLLTLSLVISLAVPAQTSPYPQDYFRNPLGIPMQLSANFGELRPNHWHMGLDIRTNAKENQPVYAAAEGYIAHVGIRAQSFGRFIIIRHPNGLSTLYAHLNDFNPGLEEYVRSVQQQEESWVVEIDLDAKKFPVHKGDFIAYSGNTGGSQGPHLHFEIMDTKTEKRLNPLLFGFPLQDNMPPVLIRLAMYDRSRSVFEQSPVIFPLKKTDSGYIIPGKPVIKTGLSKVSFALQMIDKMNGGGSDNGVFAAKLSADNTPQIEFILDSIDYEETHYINAHIDYKYDYNGGAYLQHLSQLPGHFGAEYHQIAGNGVINLPDTIAKAITIEVRDAQGNTSHLDFAVQHDDSLETPFYDAAIARFAPGRENKFSRAGFEIYLPETCIYDSVPIYYNNPAYTGYNAVSEMYSVGISHNPVHGTFTVRLKQNRGINEDQKSKLVIVQEERKGKQIKKAIWDNGWIKANFGEFGTFQAFLDLTPPSVSSPGGGDTVNLSAVSRIVFTPTDNFGVKSFKAVLYSCASDTSGYHCSDDSLSEYRWLRFTNDKSRNWIYKFDEQLPYGVHKLKVTVEDIVGNTSTREWWIKRLPYTPPPPKKKTSKKTSSKKKEDSKKKTDTKKTSGKKTTSKAPAKKKK